MEKLRKRYRAKIQRIGNNPNGRGRFPPSSWVHFKWTDDMELGFGCSGSGNGNRDDEDEEEDEDNENEEGLMLYPKGIKQAIALPLSRRAIGNGVRIRIPNVVNVKPPALNVYNPNRVFDDYPPSMNPNYGLGKGMRDGYVKEGEKGRNVGGGVMKWKKIEDVERKEDSGSGDG